MALTESRTPTDARAAGAPETATLDGLLGSADHKTLGRFWIAGGLLFLLGSLVVSAVAGLETLDLGSYSIAKDADQFTQIWSLGREVLLFGGLLPILVGLATYLVPLQIGAPAIAFARGAAGAFWAWLIGTALLVVSYVFNGGPGGGKADFVVLWAVSLGLVILGLLWAMVIVATTALGARTIGMTLDRVPFATWSFLVFCLYGILTLPLVIADLALTYVRVRHGFVPLDARQTLVGVTNLFSYAPTLFWLAIPALGMATDAVGVHTGRPVMLRKPVLAAIGALSVTSYGAVYFSFGSVRSVDFDNFVLVADIAATVLPILGVLGLAGESIRRGTPRLNVAFIGSMLGGLLFLLTSVAALLGLFEPVQLWLIDKADTGNPDKLLVLNGTTFHDGLRGIAVGAAVLAITGALHHWAPKIWGRRMTEALGFGAVLAAAGGGVLWGLGGILAGVDNQPAYPVSSLAGGDNVELYNLITLIGILAVTAGALLTALNAAQAAVARNTAAVGGPGWTGLTLEWATSSPPSPGNFDQPPVVRSATPLADAVPESGSAEPTTGTDAGGEA